MDARINLEDWRHIKILTSEKIVKENLSKPLIIIFHAKILITTMN